MTLVCGWFLFFIELILGYIQFFKTNQLHIRASNFLSKIIIIRLCLKPKYNMS